MNITKEQVIEIKVALNLTSADLGRLIGRSARTVEAWCSKARSDSPGELISQRLASLLLEARKKEKSNVR